MFNHISILGRKFPGFWTKTVFLNGGKFCLSWVQKNFPRKIGKEKLPKHFGSLSVHFRTFTGMIAVVSSTLYSDCPWVGSFNKASFFSEKVFSFWSVLRLRVKLFSFLWWKVCRIACQNCLLRVLGKVLRDFFLNFVVCSIFQEKERKSFGLYNKKDGWSKLQFT